MKRGRFTKEQIIAVLREHEAGAKTAVLAQARHLEATPGPTGRLSTAAAVSVAKPLRMLEDENRKLKKLLATSMLATLGSRICWQKMYGPPRRCKVFRRLSEAACVKCIRPLASKLLLQPAMMRCARIVAGLIDGVRESA